ncbi:hypothetical protein TNCV_99031 [Trichonephila clavipes]|nr:hypothetical protein TNCV_99031 [Trichonephila clavipes]
MKPMYQYQATRRTRLNTKNSTGCYNLPMMMGHSQTFNQQNLISDVNIARKAPRRLFQSNRQHWVFSFCVACATTQTLRRVYMRRGCFYQTDLRRRNRRLRSYAVGGGVSSSGV